MKARLIIILISNMFMLHVIIPILKIARLNNLVGIIVKQLQTNINHVEQQLKGSAK